MLVELSVVEQRYQAVVEARQRRLAPVCEGYGYGRPGARSSGLQLAVGSRSIPSRIRLRVNSTWSSQPPPMIEPWSWEIAPSEISESRSGQGQYRPRGSRRPELTRRAMRAYTTPREEGRAEAWPWI